MREFLITAECDCFNTARDLEELLDKVGFDTRKQVGNGQDDSMYVYMYRKMAGVTRE